MEAFGLLAILIAWAAIKCASLAFIFWFDAYYPDVFERIHATYTLRARRSVLLGVFNMLAWLIVAALLFSTQLPIFSLFGLMILAMLVGAATLGYSPAYRELGERLAEGSDTSRTRKLALGWLCLEAAFLTPIIGQFLSFAVMIRGLGAVVAAVLAARRNNDEADETYTTPTPPPVRTPETDPSS